MTDSLGMIEATYGLADQFIEAVSRTDQAANLPNVDGVNAIVVFGMGGSGIAGDVLSAIAGPHASVPLIVSKHYECPGFVGPNTLVFAVSFSGNTEETLNAVHEADARGARIIALCSGGELMRLAHERDWGVITIDTSIPMPRAGIGAVSVPLLLITERLGFTTGVEAQVNDTIAHLTERVAALRSKPASIHKLAKQIGNTFPIVYGGGQLGEVAATRWKGQFNENPKVAAFANRVPELTHNEICGWAQHGDVSRQVFSTVLLRHDYEHGQVDKRMAIIDEVYIEIVAGVHQVEANGSTPLAQLFDLILVGDLVTLELAAQAGIDPGPVPILDDIKEQLRPTE